MKKINTSFLILLISLIMLSAPVSEAFVVYSEKFEDNDGGYTHSGTLDCWEWGTPSSWISTAGEGDKCWGTNLTGNYSNSAGFTLSSPTIDLTGIHSGSTLTLKWKRAKYIEHGWDNAYLSAVPEAGSPVTLWSHNSEDSVISGWTELSADISDLAGSKIRLDWSFGSDTSVVYAGLYVDDIRIETPYTPSYTVTASADVHGTVSPDVASVDLGEDLTVTIRPGDGYELDYLAVEISGDVSFVYTLSGDSYTLENVSDDISLMAYFALDGEMLAHAGLDDMDIKDTLFSLSLQGSPELPEGVASDDYEVLDFNGVGSPAFTALTSDDVSGVSLIREIFLQGLSFDLAMEASSDAAMPILVTDMVLIVSRDVLGEAVCASIDEGLETVALEPTAESRNIADDFFHYVRLFKVIDGVPCDLYALGQGTDPGEDFLTVDYDEDAYYVEFTLALVDREAGDAPTVQALLVGREADAPPAAQITDLNGFFFVFDGEADGHFRDPLVLTTLPKESLTGGSGGSCNVGFSPAWALLLLPLLGLLKKQ